jgi:hypothetical protein
MSSIDLTELSIRDDEIVPFEFGGLLPSALGASSDRIARLGDRYAARVTTPAMHIEPEGRRWSAKLLRARRLGAIITIHQPGFNIGAPGAPMVAEAVAGGRTIPLVGLTPNYPIRMGQWFNYFDTDGQRYLDQFATQVVANADGEAEVEIQNLLRVELAEDAAISLRPCIEGWIEGDFSIRRPVELITSFSFLVSEKA